MAEIRIPMDPQPVMNERGYWNWRGCSWWGDDPILPLAYFPSNLVDVMSGTVATAERVELTGERWDWIVAIRELPTTGN